MATFDLVIKEPVEDFIKINEEKYLIKKDIWALETFKKSYQQFEKDKNEVDFAFSLISSFIGEEFLKKHKNSLMNDLGAFEQITDIILKSVFGKNKKELSEQVEKKNI